MKQQQIKFFSLVNFPTLLQQKKVQLAIIILIIILAYSNIFQNDFVQDDLIVIVNNWIPKSFRNIPLVLAHNHNEERGDYRPLRTIFLMISYQLWGLNKQPYHFVSVSVAILNTVLVYLIIENLTNKRTITFVSSLLFAVHPIHTESITLILGSIESIAISYYLAAFYFFLKARQYFPRYSKYYFLSILLAVFGFFHNETTLSLPLVIIFTGFCFEKLNFRKLRTMDVFKVYAPYFILALSYLFIRMVLLHIVERGQYFGSFYLTMLTMTKVFVKYIELLILPINLSIYPQVSPDIRSWADPYSRLDKIAAQSILDLDILRNIGIILSLIAAILIYLKKSPLISFSIGFFMITLLPVSNMIPIGFIMQERYLFLPSFGFVLLVGTIFEYLFHHKYPESLRSIAKGSLVAFVVVIILAYSYRTYLRNKEYKNVFVLWTKTFEQNPADEVISLLIAEDYYMINDYEKASIYYKKTLDLSPKFARANFRLGNIYNSQGKTKLALSYYTRDKDYEKYILMTNGNDNLIFFYPKIWKIIAQDKGVKLLNPTNSFYIYLSFNKLSLSPEEYFENDQDQYGNLVSQGLASIHNFNQSYVKIWNDPSTDSAGSLQESSGQVNKLQFFLFKDSKVVKALVYPADSTVITVFDDIVSSIIFI